MVAPSNHAGLARDPLACARKESQQRYDDLETVRTEKRLVEPLQAFHTLSKDSGQPVIVGLSSGLSPQAETLRSLPGGHERDKQPSPRERRNDRELISPAIAGRRHGLANEPEGEIGDNDRLLPARVGRMEDLAKITIVCEEKAVEARPIVTDVSQLVPMKDQTEVGDAAFNQIQPGIAGRVT